MKKHAADKGKEIPIRVVWDSADNLPTIYANHLYITHAGGNEFYLVFGELGPQVNLDMENPPECVEIKPVAKIAVSPRSMARLAEVVEENVSKYDKQSATTDGEASQ